MVFHGGDVHELRKCPTRVRGNDDIATPRCDESVVILADCEQYGAHDQRCGQLVQYRRQKECHSTGQPEQAAVAKTLSYQSGLQRFEHQAFVHGVDIRHSRQLEEGQF